MPLKDAVEIYYPYTFTAKEYMDTAALFHAEEFVGEEKIIKTMAEAYMEFKGGEDVYFETYESLTYELLLEKLGLNQEEFEAW